MEDCYTTIWYSNCSMCELDPPVSSEVSNDITLVILFILESVLIIAVIIAAITLFYTKRGVELVFPENEVALHSV